MATALTDPACRDASVSPTRAAGSRRRAQGRRSERWGRAAEEQAAAWYERRGGRVVARRLRTEGGEIDLVVRLADTLVFVEVRARRTVAAAIESVTAAKIARLCAAASCFPGADGDAALDQRLDLAAVGGDGSIQVVENISL